MSDTLYERYNLNDDNSIQVYGRFWRGQTFTIGNTGTNEDHTVTSVKVRCWRSGSPGTVTLDIYATDVDGKPTGDPLSTGTINGNDFTTDYAGVWYEISMSEYVLQDSTKYALILKALDGDSTNYIKFRSDNTTPTYGGGSYVTSTDSGVTWSLSTSLDAMFEEYGLVVGGEALTLELSDSISFSEAIAGDMTMQLTETLTLSESMTPEMAFNLALDDALGLSDDISVVLTAALIKKKLAGMPRKIGLPTPINVGLGV